MLESDMYKGISIMESLECMYCAIDQVYSITTNIVLTMKMSTMCEEIYMYKSSYFSIPCMPRLACQLSSL